MDSIDWLADLDRWSVSPNLQAAFDAMNERSRPFIQTAGTWQLRDGTAYEESASVDDQVVPQLVSMVRSIGDGAISALVRLNPGSHALSTAGVLFRMTDPERGLGVLLEESRGVSLVTVRQGRLTPVTHRDLPIAEDHWYRLAVSMIGERYVASLDGEVVLEATLPDAPRAGGIGFFRTHGEGAAFRDLTVRNGDEQAPVEIDFTVVPPLIAPLVSGPPRQHLGRPRGLLVQTVESANDFRRCLILPPDTTIALPIRVRSPSILQYDGGVMPVPAPARGGASQIVVSLTADDSDEVTLRREHLAADARGRPWSAVTIRLAQSHRPVTLSLSNAAVGASGGAYAAFCNPTVRPEDRERDRPNLILVTVDTLRADHLGAYGCARPTSPFLDALADRSVTFEHVMAQSSWTKTSMASLLTSTYPETNAVRTVNDRLPADFTTLAEALQQKGYFTAAVQSNPWVHPRFGLSRGFAEYHLLMATASAAMVHQLADDVLERRGHDPFFLYLHYMDVHHPYVPPESYRRFGSDAPALYDAAIRYLDDQLRDFYESLDQRGLLDRTLFVVTSDHGEEFGEHGGSFHGGTLYREVLGVPWIVEWRGRLGPKRVSSLVRNLDVAPTLLDLLGIAVPPTFQGIPLMRPLAATPHGDTLFAQVGLNDTIPGKDLLAVVSERWKYIVDRRSSAQQLFDRTNDPLELRDLSVELPDVTRAMSEESQRFVREHAHAPSNDTASLDDDLSARLRALGYLPTPAAPSHSNGAQPH